MELRVKTSTRKNRASVGRSGGQTRRHPVAVASSLRRAPSKAPIMAVAGGAGWAHFELVGWDEV